MGEKENKPIVALIDSDTDARLALKELERHGVERRRVTVVSSEPIHDLGESDGESKSLIGLFSIAGGVVGCTIGLLLTTWTSRRVGLITGGMPVVSPWAFGVIVFELTALGAILGSLFRLIVEAGFLRRGSSVRSDGIADGRIAISIECDDESRPELAGVLAKAGAVVQS